MSRNLNIDWNSEPLGEIPDPTLARSLGCHPSSVFNARKRRQIGAATKSKYAACIDRVVELRGKGWTLQDIASVFDVHHVTVLRWLHRKGLR